jgi:hypothetical protein
MSYYQPQEHTYYFIDQAKNLLIKIIRIVKHLRFSRQHSEKFASQLSEFQGLFGWAVAVKKVDVGCELWKKLL